MFKKTKIRKIALYLSLVLGLCSMFGTTAFAAEKSDAAQEIEFKLVNMTVDPNMDKSRMVKGQNYTFGVTDSSGNLYGTVSGTAIFDYDGNQATIVSAANPSVNKTDPLSTITASASGSTEGKNAVVTVSITLKKYFITNTMTAKIKCTAGGSITIE